VAEDGTAVAEGQIAGKQTGVVSELEDELGFGAEWGTGV